MKSAVIRYPELRSLTGFSRSTIWRFEKAGEFPQRIALGRNSVGWKAEEVAHWLESRPRAAAVTPSASERVEQGVA